MRERRRSAAWWLEERLLDFGDWQEKDRRALYIASGVLAWLFLVVGLLGDLVEKQVPWLVSLLVLMLLAVVVSPIAVLIFCLAVFLLNKFLQRLIPVVLYPPFALWFVLSAGWQVAVVLANVLALAPLAVLVAITRSLQIWKGIFYTCPSRDCAYRGLPVYVCPDCGTGQRNLWPNLYGLLWHRCGVCDQRLPALDLVGRKSLDRRCGGCDIPLTGRHAGKVRERLVAIVGGPGGGKTNYLLMAVHEILHGRRQRDSPICGDIDDPRQETDFEAEWRRIQRGEVAAKTSEVKKAFLLYVKAGASRCQLYLYDAPGEELASIGPVARRQYLPLLEGILLLVDPLSFEPVRTSVPGSSPAISLYEVVASTLAGMAGGAPIGRDGKLRLRVAVVLAKADLEPVRREIGDVRTGSVPGARCRAAIARWGGESALRVLEHRCESVEYFACTALGRSPGEGRGKPFQGHGVLDPLVWVLSQQLTEQVRGHRVFRHATRDRAHDLRTVSPRQSRMDGHL